MRLLEFKEKLRERMATEEALRTKVESPSEVGPQADQRPDETSDGNGQSPSETETDRSPDNGDAEGPSDRKQQTPDIQSGPDVMDPAVGEDSEPPLVNGTHAACEDEMAEIKGTETAEESQSA